MATAGLDVFDKTLQTTHVWLGEIENRLGPDRQVAWKVLGAVLHALRDRLPIELAAHLGAQLPLLVRGLYYDQFDPTRLPADCDTPDEFIAEVASGLVNVRPVDPKDAMTTVFELLERHVSEGQVAKVRHALPRALRMAWDSADTRAASEARAQG